MLTEYMLAVCKGCQKEQPSAVRLLSFQQLENIGSKESGQTALVAESKTNV
jgi:hypothetical protein